MIKIFILTALLSTSNAVFSQSIPENYKLAGSISLANKKNLGDILVASNGKYIAIEFGFRKPTIEVYDIESWTLVKSFDLKSPMYFFDAFFSKDQSEIFYLDGRGKRKYKFNIKEGTVKKVSTDEAEEHRESEYIQHFSSSSSWENGIWFTMRPGQYIYTHDYERAKIFIYKK